MIIDTRKKRKKKRIPRSYRGTAKVDAMEGYTMPESPVIIVESMRVNHKHKLECLANRFPDNREYRYLLERSQTFHLDAKQIQFICTQYSKEFEAEIGADD